MKWMDTLQAIGTGLAILGNIPGVISFLKYRNSRRILFSCTIRRPYFDKSPPNHLILKISIKSGAQEIVISSLQSPDGALGPADHLPVLSDIPPRDESMKVCTADKLEVRWRIPASTNSSTPLFSNIDFISPNRDALSVLRLKILWHTDSTWLSQRITIHHKATLNIRLKTGNQTSKPPCAETLL